MSGPMTWVDETTAWLVLAVPVGDAHDAPRWVEVLRLAEEDAGGDWTVFTTRVVDLAREQGFDDTAVTAFVETAAAAGEFTAVTSVVELGDQLPTVLTDLREAQHGTEATDDQPFGWVTDAQRGQLEQVWGSAWQEHLQADLDQRWGADWHAHPVEHRTAWLEDLIAAGTYSAPQETGEDTATDPLDWVTEEQRAHLSAGLGDQWPATLAADLDQRWGADWHAHPAEHKTAWLDDLVAAGTYAAAEPGAEQAVPEAATEAMADLLASMRAVPGAESLSDEELARIVAETVGKAGS